MSNVIDLDKVKAAKEKIKSSPEVCKELSDTITKAVNSTGIKLTSAEAKYLIREIIEDVESGGEKGNFLCVFCC